jgi:nucleotide-binding universal stress UspA family protein
LVAGLDADPQPYEERARRLVDDALAAAGHDLEGIDVECVVSLGNPAPVLLAHAAKDDIIIVGSRGRGGFTGLLLGSVSQQVILHARCPVVVVRGENGLALGGAIQP